MENILRFLRDERGTETVEWAIIIGFIGLAAVALVTTIGGKISAAFSALDAALN